MKYYLPIFTKEADELYEANAEKIRQFNALPFWKKWGKRESLRQEIVSSWMALDKTT